MMMPVKLFRVNLYLVLKVALFIYELMLLVDMLVLMQFKVVLYSIMMSN